MSDKGQQIVFVEDNPIHIRLHIKSLKEHLEKKNRKYEFVICRTLLHAVAHLKDNSEIIKLVVIDLYLPGDYSVLEDYIPDVSDGIKLNQGQLLAAHILDYYEIPYLYLTSLGDRAYTGKENDKVFDKHPDQDKLRAFIERVDTELS